MTFRIGARLALVVIFVEGLTTLAPSQRVMEEPENYAVLMNSIRSHARKQGFEDWPNLAGAESGTVLNVSFSYNDADISVFAADDIDLPQLVSISQELAVGLGYPRADYHIKKGAHSRYVDIELNEYIERNNTTHQIAINLSGLASAVARDRRFPRPVFLQVDADEAENASLTLRGRPAEIGQYKLFRLSEVPPDSKVMFKTHRTWLTYVWGGLVPTFFGAVFLGITVLPWTVFPRQQRRRLEMAATLKLKLSPEEIQAKYDKGPPKLTTTLIPLAVVPIVVVVPPLIINGERALTWIGIRPPGSFSSLPFFIVCIIANLLLARWITDRRAKRNYKSVSDDQVLVPSPQDPLAKVAIMLFLASIGLMGVLSLLLSWVPAFSRLDHSFRFPLLLMPILIIPIGLIFTSRKKGGQPLSHPFKPGDEWYDAAMIMGAKVGVKVRKVSRLPGTNANAFASIFGTVNLTQGLLDQLDDSEVRAVLAHEIGHLRHNHVRRNFAISLVLTIAALTVQFWLLRHFEGQMSPEVLALARSPIMGMVVLPLCLNFIMGPARRRAEFEADRLALEETRDPDLVMRALTKIHEINAQPSRLKRADELFSTHPSLENRLASLRRITSEMGLPYSN